MRHVDNGQLTLDSGIFNMELLTKDYGEQVARIWRKMQLKPRMEAIAAHELAESKTGSHVEALTAGADTRLPVSHEARELLRAMEKNWKWRPLAYLALAFLPRVPVRRVLRPHPAMVSPEHPPPSFSRFWPNSNRTTPPRPPAGRSHHGRSRSCCGAWPRNRALRGSKTGGSSLKHAHLSISNNQPDDGVTMTHPSS